MDVARENPRESFESGDISMYIECGVNPAGTNGGVSRYMLVSERRYAKVSITNNLLNRIVMNCAKEYPSCPFGCAKDGGPNCHQNIKDVACPPAKNYAQRNTPEHTGNYLPI